MRSAGDGGVSSLEFDPADPRNEIYSRPANYLKVFVSSKMRDGAFAVERQAAIEAIDGAPYFQAWAWERDAAAGLYYSVEECVRQAGTSDALVLILGDELTEVTRSEFEAATSTGAPAFVMLDAQAVRDAPTDAFVTEFRRHAITVPFASEGELRTQITRALRAWLFRDARETALRRRATLSFTGPELATRDVEPVPANAEPYIEAFASVRDAIDFRSAAASAADAIAAALETVEGVIHIGAVQVALRMVRELDELSTGTAGAQRAWVLNLRGLVAVRMDSDSDAERFFSEMRQIGRSLDDRRIISTAGQNLGIIRSRRGDVAEARNLFRESFRLKVELGDEYGAAQVILNLVTTLIEEERWQDARELVEELHPALMRGDPGLLSSIHGNLGRVAAAAGEFAEAKRSFLRARRLARRAGSSEKEIGSLQCLGACAMEQERFTEAARWYSKAVDRALDAGDRTQVRRQRGYRAGALAQAGRAVDAAKTFELVAADASDDGLIDVEAAALGDAAACWHLAGDSGRAIERIQRALATGGHADDDRWRMSQLRNFALILADDKRTGDALEQLRAAVNLAPEWWEQANLLGEAGEIALASEAQAGDAADLFRAELDLRRSHQPGDQWGWRSAEIGARLSDSPRPVDAIEFFTRALRVFAARGEMRQTFFIRNDRAIALADLGRLGHAAQDLRRCLEIATEAADRVLEQQAYMNLGEVTRRRGHIDEARSMLIVARRLATDLEDLRRQAETDLILGLLEADAGDTRAAETRFNESEALGRALADPLLVSEAVKGRAHLAADAGRHAGAARLYRRAARGQRRARGKAECLVGILYEDAQTGRFDGTVLDELVSLALGSGLGAWLAASLVPVFVSVAEHGRTADAASLGALLIVLGCREASEEMSGSPESDEGALERAVTLVVVWLHEDAGESSHRLASVLDDVASLAGDEIREIVGSTLRVVLDDADAS